MNVTWILVTLKIILRRSLHHVELYAFYEWNEEKRQLATIKFVKRIQNDV